MIEINEIYCDMDQVLVNFLGGTRHVLGKEFNDLSLGEDHDKWLLIDKVPNFWVHLEWMPGAKMLWDCIKNKNTYILSAFPTEEENPQCSTEKKMWCQRELGISPDRVFIVKRNEKKTFARRNNKANLLIDDHYNNVDIWHRKGGFGIWHQTVPETLIELQQFGDYKDDKFGTMASDGQHTTSIIETPKVFCIGNSQKD